jgi:hypothetical protein
MADGDVSDATDYEQALPRYIIEGDIPVELGSNDTDAWMPNLDATAEVLARHRASEIDDDHCEHDDDDSELLEILSSVRQAAGVGDRFVEGDDNNNDIGDGQDTDKAKKYSMQELMELIAEGKTPADVRQIDDKYLLPFIDDWCRQGLTTPPLACAHPGRQTPMLQYTEVICSVRSRFAPSMIATC